METLLALAGIILTVVGFVVSKSASSSLLRVLGRSVCISSIVWFVYWFLWMYVLPVTFFLSSAPGWLRAIIFGGLGGSIGGAITWGLLGSWKPHLETSGVEGFWTGFIFGAFIWLVFADVITALQVDIARGIRSTSRSVPTSDVLYRAMTLVVMFYGILMGTINGLVFWFRYGEKIDAPPPKPKGWFRR